jgi:hypothetical protein
MYPNSVIEMMHRRHEELLREAEAERLYRSAMGNRPRHQAGAGRTNQTINAAAADLYDKAHRQARWSQAWSKLSRRPHALMPLTDIQASRAARGSHAGGVRSVALDRIEGSEGRRAEFDTKFRPLQTHTKERWLRVAHAMLKGVALPPVELVQVGDRYFVRDGHHRVSVARALGQTDIDAHVTVQDVDLAALCSAESFVAYPICETA